MPVNPSQGCSLSLHWRLYLKQGYPGGPSAVESRNARLRTRRGRKEEAEGEGRLPAEQPRGVEDRDWGGSWGLFWMPAPAPPLLPGLWEEGGAGPGRIVYKHLRPLTAPADGTTSFSSGLGPCESHYRSSRPQSPELGLGGNAGQQDTHAFCSRVNPAVICTSCGQLTRQPCLACGVRTPTLHNSCEN